MTMMTIMAMATAPPVRPRVYLNVHPLVEQKCAWSRKTTPSRPEDECFVALYGPPIVLVSIIVHLKLAMNVFRLWLVIVMLGLVVFSKVESHEALGLCVYILCWNWEMCYIIIWGWFLFISYENLNIDGGII